MNALEFYPVSTSDESDPDPVYYNDADAMRTALGNDIVCIPCDDDDSIHVMRDDELIGVAFVS